MRAVAPACIVDRRNQRNPVIRLSRLCLLESCSLIIWLSISAPATAHSLSSPSAISEGWLLAPLMISAAWFAYGWWNVHARARESRIELRRKALLFGSGWLVIAASLLSPLHELGERSFTVHMIEHELLMLVAAPLLALSRPLGVFLWALPAKGRTGFVSAARMSWCEWTWAWLTQPFVATVLQAIALWLWHAPRLFDLALNGEGWHALQHVSLLGSAMLFWWSMTPSTHGRAASATAAFYLFITSMHSGLLGALMSLAASPWYSAYIQIGANGPMIAGLSPLEDQQLAGLIMWVPGGAVHAGAALIYLMRWLKPAEEGLRTSVSGLRPEIRMD